MRQTKLISVLVIVLGVLSVLSAYAGGQTESTAKPSGTQAAAATAQPAKIYIYQSKYEIDGALKAATAQYAALHPNVTFTVESSSSGDFETELKSMFAANKAPDIFSTGGNVDLALMSDYMEDLSGQPWVKYMSKPALEGGSYQGKVYGFPLAVEGHGYLYHKDMFKAAGITAIPTTRSELEAVCKKLQSAGITPFSANYSEWYQAAIFEFNSPIARQPNPLGFIDAMNKGTASIVGNKDFRDMAALIALEVKYAKSPLNTDFNTQVSDFTTGKTAMMLGGSWSQAALDQVDPHMDVGMFPMPMSEDAAANDKFYASAEPFWSVNKASQSKDASEQFLDWLAMTPEGQKNLTTGFKLIPAFTNIQPDESAIGPTGSTLIKYIDAGKTYGIYSAYYPKGFGGAQLFGETLDKYAAGKLTADQLLAELQKNWESLTK